jgi:hypothetical protein
MRLLAFAQILDYFNQDGTGRANLQIDNAPVSLAMRSPLERLALAKILCILWYLQEAVMNEF